MREIPLTNNEYDFICSSIKDACGLRIDQRGLYDLRDIDIKFNEMLHGGCIVSLGSTKVLAQTSADLVKPKDTRPNEGILKINLELSPMAAQHFEPNKQTDYAVELNRMLERNLILSRCVDVESLCIRAGEKVWCVRVDVNVLNYEGNILDCSNIAVLCALASFKLPEVTFEDEQHKLIRVLSEDERMPQKLNLIHLPLTITFALFEQGKHVLLDPLEIEERCCDGRFIIGMNKHREICMMQLTGSVLMLKEQIQRYVKIATSKVTQLTEIIIDKLKEIEK